MNKLRKFINDFQGLQCPESFEQVAGPEKARSLFCSALSKDRHLQTGQPGSPLHWSAVPWVSQWSIGNFPQTAPHKFLSLIGGKAQREEYSQFFAEGAEFHEER